MMGIRTGPYTGSPEKIGNLPITNTARGVQAVTQGTWAEPIGQIIGILGKPEEWVRKKAGVPEFGEYTDYYIDRQLANMVVEGVLSAEQAQLAMIERQGEFFEQARERVKLELAMRVPTMGTLYAGLHEGPVAGAQAFMPSLFGSGLLPQGELEYRGLKQEWNEAWKRADMGDDKAVPEFFDEHPEYEAYLAKNKEPDERLRTFLVNQVKDGYYALGETNRKQAASEMGELFRQSFLDKETSSYDAQVSLSIDTLTTWAQMLNKAVPKVPETQAARAQPRTLNLYDPNVTAITDEFFQQRNKYFPNWYEEQQGYYAVPRSQRASYLREHPNYAEFRKWQDRWYDNYPSLVPVFKSQVFKQIDTSTWPPMLANYVAMYAFTNEPLPPGAKKALEQIWIMEGRPYDDFKVWLTSQVVPAFLYGNGGMTQ